jgi:hypothetical protein
MKLKEVIKRLGPRRRMRVHVSLDYIYCLGEVIWDLDKDDTEDMDEKIQKTVERMIGK